MPEEKTELVRRRLTNRINEIGNEMGRNVSRVERATANRSLDSFRSESVTAKSRGVLENLALPTRTTMLDEAGNTQKELVNQ